MVLFFFYVDGNKKKKIKIKKNLPINTSLFAIKCSYTSTNMISLEDTDGIGNLRKEGDEKRLDAKT